MNLTIDAHERYLILGKTGSGKTEFVKYLLRLVQQKMPIVIVDPKYQWLGDYPQWETDKKKPGTVDKPHLVEEFNPKYWVQCIQVDEQEDEERINKLCFDILKHRNWYLYFDETEGIANAHHIPTGIRRVWKTGRSKGIGTWVATQTPSGIPRIWKSQAEKFFTFKVGREDVDLAAWLTNATKEDVASLGNYEYLYYDTKADMDVAEWQPPIPYEEKEKAS